MGLFVQADPQPEVAWVDPQRLLGVGDVRCDQAQAPGLRDDLPCGGVRPGPVRSGGWLLAEGLGRFPGGRGRGGAGRTGLLGWEENLILPEDLAREIGQGGAELDAGDGASDSRGQPAPLPVRELAQQRPGDHP